MPSTRWRLSISCFAVVCSLIPSSCGGGSNGASHNQVPPSITSVKVTGSDSIVLVGQTLTFTAAVQGTGEFSSAVTWAVNGVVGGNAQCGTINNGDYQAPSTIPSPNTVTISATSVVDSTKSGSASATVYTIAISPTDPTVAYGQTEQFTATVSGLSSNPGIQWSALTGQISNTGLYSAPSLGSVPSQDTVSAKLVGEAIGVSTSVELQVNPPKLDSLSPGQAIVGQTITLNVENLINAISSSLLCRVVFRSRPTILQIRQTR